MASSVLRVLRSTFRPPLRLPSSLSSPLMSPYSLLCIARSCSCLAGSCRAEASASHFLPAAQDVSSPTYMIWGANTNVGKSLVSAGLANSILCRYGLGDSHARRVEEMRDTKGLRLQNNGCIRDLRFSSDVLYVKPLQTGFPADSDSDFVAQKVRQVLLSNSSAASKRVLISSYIQKVSSTVSKARMHGDTVGYGFSKPFPGIDKISIKHVDSGSMEDYFRYEGYILEAEGTGKPMFRRINTNNIQQILNDDLSSASNLTCTTMWSWYHAVSPHLAAAQEGCYVSDSSVLHSLRTALWNFHQGRNKAEIEQQSSKELPRWALVETAGGVASPGPSGTLQCDLYRPFRFPGVLVGDGKLGGISNTITAYESLQLRGYDIAVIILADSGLANDKLLLNHLHHRVPVLTLPRIPEDSSDNLVDWFNQSHEVFSALLEVLEADYWQRIQRLEDMPKQAAQQLWWPFTQHSLVPEKTITVIDSRCGECFTVYKDTLGCKVLAEQFDACASWWTQGPDAKLQLELAKQISYIAGRFGHVMLPENVYEPVLKCAELLLDGVGKAWADRVYFSDNGSTAIEIALKMAFRKYLIDHELLKKSTSEMSVVANKLRVLALRGSYHGDTLGAQEAQAPSAYVGFLQQPWYKGRALLLEPPLIFMHNRQWCLQVPDCYKNTNLGKSNWSSRDEFFCEERENSELAAMYREYILDNLSTETCSHVGALIMEPVIHAAGGMNLIDPLFQRVLVKECKAKGIPVIFDEVFSGCWRLGAQCAAELIGCTPDIACYSKLLTGGTVPLAATLATHHIFEAFEGQSKVTALLHGHSYSGHAIGCQAAVTSLQWFCDSKRNPNLLSDGYQLKELWEPGIVLEISAHPAVQRVISLGTVFALELKVDTLRTGYSSTFAKGIVQALREDGIYVRPLGNVMYMMCGPITPPSMCSRLLLTLYRQLDLQFCTNESQQTF